MPSLDNNLNGDERQTHEFPTTTNGGSSIDEEEKDIMALLDKAESAITESKDGRRRTMILKQQQVMEVDTLKQKLERLVKMEAERNLDYAARYKAFSEKIAEQRAVIEKLVEERELAEKLDEERALAQKVADERALAQAKYAEERALAQKRAEQWALAEAKRAEERSLAEAKLAEDNLDHKQKPGWAMDERTKDLILVLQGHWLNEYKNSRKKLMVEMTAKLNQEFLSERQKLLTELLAQFKDENDATKQEFKQRYRETLKQDLQKLNEKHRREIKNAKKKQWCWQCEAEAIYHCCWNTAYCSIECQHAHWSTHHKYCRRNKGVGAVPE